MSAPQSDEIDEPNINALTERIIGLAIEAHRELGPGLLEQVYFTAMCIELEAARIPYQQQVRIPAKYKGRVLGYYRIDLIVDGRVVVEIKSLERSNPVHEAQVLTYLRVTGCQVGLLINFNSRLVKDGVHRLAQWSSGQP